MNTLYRMSVMTDAPRPAGFSLRGESLSPEERAVINAFASHIRCHRTCVMRIGDIVKSPDSAESDAKRSAIFRLVARGWLVTDASQHCENHHESVLIGDALRMAQAIAAEIRA